MYFGCNIRCRNKKKYKIRNKKIDLLKLKKIRKNN